MNRNTILSTKIRPTVIFNVKNEEHRRWAHRFITTMSWGGCPYVFAVPHTESNVYSMLIRELSVYYTNEEFAVVKKPQKGKVVKIKVDRINERTYNIG